MLVVMVVEKECDGAEVIGWREKNYLVRII